MIGDLEKATGLMERLLRISSPLGLYAEEFEVERARHLGNFPQAFSHLALVEAAARIIVGPPISMFSTSLWSVASLSAATFSKAYRFTITISIRPIE